MVVQVTVDLAKCLHDFPKLQTIKLDGCLVTFSGMKAIANLPASLEELSLSKCSGVTDEGLSLVLQSHKELRRLDITCCRKITDVTIDALTVSCPSLTSLKMESCSLVSESAFCLIGDRCLELKVLDVTDNKIDNQGGC